MAGSRSGTPASGGCSAESSPRAAWSSSRAAHPTAAWWRWARLGDTSLLDVRLDARHAHVRRAGRLRILGDVPQRQPDARHRESADGTLRLWDIESEQAIGAPLPGPTGHFAVAMFTPDDSALIAGYDTGRAIRWDIRPASFIRRACQLAGPTLTRTEWAECLPGRDFDPACA